MTHNAELDAEQQDEYYLATPALRNYVGAVRQVLAEHDEVEARLAALKPRFAELLADQIWLSEEFAAANPQGGMGGGIGSWLLYRSADRSLTIISLVVPSLSQTPVHDHLAWGLVGLYRGEQSETVYRRTDHGHPHALNNHENDHDHSPAADYAHLELAQVNQLKPGDIYTLIPPEGDIHSVKTTSDTVSISIHMLANDVGCVLRHSFEPDKNRVQAFRSGYSNVDCPDQPGG